VSLATPAWKRFTWKPDHTALAGKVAIVTGATRGVGKGIALGLAEAGATVYITGRTDSPQQGLHGSLSETSIQVKGLGGKGISVVCDHSKDDNIEALFDQVLREQGRIDILVNNVFQVPFTPIEKPEKLHFWESGTAIWDPIMNVGLRSQYVASCLAAKTMIKQNSGLIINISNDAACHYSSCVPYGVCKCAVDRMTKDMAFELKPYNVTAVSLWPGLVKTEKNIDYEEYLDTTQHIDLKGHGETPLFTGRIVAALAADTKVHSNNGQVLTNSSVAKSHGITDIDGRQPREPGSFLYSAEHSMAYLWKQIKH
jgi:dehydrogenase/reductase SDR family protein 1